MITENAPLVLTKDFVKSTIIFNGDSIDFSSYFMALSSDSAKDYFLAIVHPRLMQKYIYSRMTEDVLDMMSSDIVSMMSVYYH